MDPRSARSQHPRRVAAACAAVLGLSALVLSQLHAQRYPDRPLRLIVPFPPGGGNDILARAVGQRLAESLGQQIIVDNRGGAGGMVGAATAAGANPDGYTLFLGSLGSLAHNPALRPKLPYDPARDFGGVSLLATSPFVLVTYPGLAAQSVKDLIALARAKPGSLNYGSAGTGSSLHLTGELFKHAAGVDIVHVGYKGTAPAITDLIAGQVQMVFSTMPPALPHVKTGRLRSLGVTSAKRARAVPDVPTIAEAGVPGFEVENWQGIVVPIRTPRAVVERLNREILGVLAQPAMIAALDAQGLDPAGSAPAQFDRLVRAEIKKWTKLARAARIQVD
jgi:tripartite-type tricarboxylate transporter receptor subunit TctC